MDNLSLSDLITPIAYIRLLWVYDYVIDDLEASLLQFSREYCPNVFKTIFDDKIIDRLPSDQIKIFTRSNNENISIHSIDFNQIHCFPYERVLEKGTPLFFLHQINVSDGTLLAAGIHHRLTDGFGFMNLLHRFSLWTTHRSIPPLFDHDRSIIGNKMNSKVLFQHDEYYTCEKIQSTILPPKDMKIKSIIQRFSKKKLFEKLSISHDYVSLNDVLVTWLTKTISEARNVPDTITIKVGMPMNARKYLSLSDDYFGNCVFYMYFPFLMRDLKSKSVDELSKEFHQRRKSYMQEEYIASALAYMADVIKQPNRMYYPIFNILDEYDIAFTSWARFPVYDIDFGHGPPKSLIFPPSQRKFTVVKILPTNSTTNDVEVHIAIREESSDRFLNLIHSG